ncbi:MAG TPA: hypothetical protein PK170_02525 [Anaerolineae bacterium]|nr:hypothetical protein [Anaerolineae bacterium]
MSGQKLSGQALCLALMNEVCRTIYLYAEGRVNLVRHGAQTALEEDWGKNILKLRSALTTEEQIEALEAILHEVQEDVLGSLFALIDGSSQPLGWPDEIRLVNMDTGEVICPEGLEWNFGLALAEYRARVDADDEEQDTHKRSLGDLYRFGG